MHAVFTLKEKTELKANASASNKNELASIEHAVYCESRFHRITATAGTGN